MEIVGSGMNISDPQHWFHFKLPVLLFKLVQVVIEPVLPATARLHSRVPVGQKAINNQQIRYLAGHISHPIRKDKWLLLRNGKGKEYEHYLAI
jgi:hypothetical protein